MHMHMIKMFFLMLICLTLVYFVDSVVKLSESEDKVLSSLH